MATIIKSNQEVLDELIVIDASMQSVLTAVGTTNPTQ